MENKIEILQYTVEELLKLDTYDLCELCAQKEIELTQDCDSKLDIIYCILTTICPEAIDVYENTNNWNELRVDYYTSYSLNNLLKYTDEAVFNETKRVCEELELKLDKGWSKEEQCIFLIKVCDMNKFTDTYILPNSINQKDEEYIEVDKDRMWNKTRKELKEICCNENIEIGDNWKKERLIKAINERKSHDISNNYI